MPIQHRVKVGKHGLKQGGYERGKGDHFIALPGTFPSPFDIRQNPLMIEARHFGSLLAGLQSISVVIGDEMTDFRWNYVRDKHVKHKSIVHMGPRGYAEKISHRHRMLIYRNDHGLFVDQRTTPGHTVLLKQSRNGAKTYTGQDLAALLALNYGNIKKCESIAGDLVLDGLDQLAAFGGLLG